MNPPYPLSDIRVLELANVLAGPSVGMFLAELGADVIKIESPKTAGDGTRQWLLPSEDPTNSVSAYFSSVNWGKQSVAVDLKTTEGKELLHGLAKNSDVILTSYKPGSAQRLSADFETLTALNPAIIYVSITGFGPDSDRSGYDAIIQAESGFFFMNGSADGPPTKIPVALMDVLAGHQAKEAVLLALLERMKTGKGKHIEVSLIQTALASLVNQGTNWLMAGHDPQRMGSGHPNIVPYGDPFQCRDGRFLVLAVGTDAQFECLCDIISIREIAAHPNYQHNAQRVKNKRALLKILQEAVLKFSSSQLFDLLTNAKVPVGRIMPVSEALKQPWAEEIRMEDETGLGKTSGISSFVAHGIAKRKLSPPPEYARDTQLVLSDVLGLTKKELESLKGRGVIDYANSNMKS